jgi:hypothetical protein
MCWDRRRTLGSCELRPELRQDTGGLPPAPEWGAVLPSAVWENFITENGGTRRGGSAGEIIDRGGGTLEKRPGGRIVEGTPGISLRCIYKPQQERERRGRGDLLTENQKKAVAMLFDGAKVQDTAQAVGVHRTTIWRWKKTKDFRREWNRISRNLRRKYERKEARRRAEESALWDTRRRQCEEKVKAEAAKISGRPGPAFYRAWNDYEKALCRGMSLSRLFDLLLEAERKYSKGEKQ